MYKFQYVFLLQLNRVLKIIEKLVIFCFFIKTDFLIRSDKKYHYIYYGLKGLKMISQVQSFLKITKYY